ncbi:MAG: alpha/beta hydrolase fold domain-containing protein [Gammaproteobacteria bacterium]|nr:alpha/beta hydrolase fold domain-containing protein [Gammaproteobacteria bacterium]NIM72084.1 alpha/beta hydrolase fold domain-containing protein [Gammaproteobacteria bacterium]NIN38365.1 alpha/beta hydrolase fold domain-containing protein [Gammaproteobacteria bacterium]NIO23811.1 alpha/beta hydrolase fold domain-containing protein [Gammaproteobacteria bacterium]NIO64453.1 alpha/beta hydrolase fold domain-containing protein [Gammaproteobacteria bacterium]
MTIDPELETQYNARAAVPEHVDIQTGWRHRSEQLRARRSCRLDLAYGDSERQKIDLIETGVANAPLAVYLHGGYWQRGDRRDNHFIAESLCANGINVAVVGYDLCPQVTIDDIVAQVRAALAWLWRHADDLGFDADRIQVCGHSAGGHLTAMLMATPWPDVARDLPADLVHSGLAISGLYTLEPLLHTSINEAVSMDARTARRNSPAFMPRIGSATVTAAVGALESEGFHLQAHTLAERWHTPAAPVDVVEVPGANHFTIVDALAGPGVLLERALAMLGQR